MKSLRAALVEELRYLGFEQQTILVNRHFQDFLENSSGISSVDSSFFSERDSYEAIELISGPGMHQNEHFEYVYRRHRKFAFSFIVDSNPVPDEDGYYEGSQYKPVGDCKLNCVKEKKFLNF